MPGSFHCDAIKTSPSVDFILVKELENMCGRNVSRFSFQIY